MEKTKWADESEGVIQHVVGLLIEFVDTAEGDVRVGVGLDDIGVLAEADHKFIGEEAGEAGGEPAAALEVILDVDLLGGREGGPDGGEEGALA